MTDFQTAKAGVGGSSAKQLLAALNLSSEDMAKTVDACCSRIIQLNEDLESKLSERIKKIGKQLELITSAHVAGIMEEKDTMLAEISVLRLEELKHLRAMGKSLREALISRLQELIKQHRQTLDQALKKCNEELLARDSSAENTLSRLRKKFNDEESACLFAVCEGISREHSELEDLHAEYRETLNNECHQRQNELVDRCADLTARLHEDIEIGESEFAVHSENCRVEQAQRLEHCRQLMLSQQDGLHAEMKVLQDSSSSNLKKLFHSFMESAQELTELHVALHGNNAANLALQYRTELLSMAKETEDQMQIARADYRATLLGFERECSQQIESLLTKFERAVQQNSSVSSRRGEGPPESTWSSRMRKALKEKLQQSISNKLSAANSMVEKSFENFSLEVERINAHNFNTVREVFDRRQEELQKLEDRSNLEFQKLTVELDSLEQLFAEARELLVEMASGRPGAEA